MIIFSELNAQEIPKLEKINLKIKKLIKIQYLLKKISQIQAIYLESLMVMEMMGIKFQKLVKNLYHYG